jgi:V8-like Glu-specific endopeptidase
MSVAPSCRFLQHAVVAAFVLLLPLAGRAQVIGEVMHGDGFEHDPSIQADLDALQGAHAEALQGLFGVGGPAAPLTITYIGKDQRREGDAYEAPALGVASTPSPAFGGVSAFNPDSGNEFRIELADSDLIDIEAETARIGRQNPAGPNGDPSPTDDPDTPVPGRATPKAWSNNSDNRVLRSSLTEGTTTWPWRAIAEHSNRCTGTLVGPRHIVTAGHCLYNRTTNAWASGYFVTPGRAGGNWSYGRSRVPTAGQFAWYFTPWQWRQANPSGGSGQYDFGIVVLPDRLGDQTGWMGYATLGNSDLQNGFVVNRGFPWCNAVDQNGNTRTDDVGDDPLSGLTCQDRHLWGDASSCSIGNFHDLDGDQWARRFDHSCDASAGQSGSPLYTYLNGVPAVIGVHTTSLCNKTAADVPCQPTDQRPLRATRITPEYRAWISYFRNWKP